MLTDWDAFAFALARHLTYRNDDHRHHRAHRDPRARLRHCFARQRAFVSDASHELRTPLTAIRGQLEVLARRENPDGEEIRRVQGLVQAEVDRMTRLTEDLLLLAHTDQTRFIQREAIDLQRFLGELLASAQPTTDRRLSLNAQTPGMLNADRDRLAQALRNLLRNAVEHTQAGGTIELGARECPDGRVRIWVTSFDSRTVRCGAAQPCWSLRSAEGSATARLSPRGPERGGGARPPSTRSGVPRRAQCVRG